MILVEQFLFIVCLFFKASINAEGHQWIPLGTIEINQWQILKSLGSCLHKRGDLAGMSRNHEWLPLLDKFHSCPHCQLCATKWDLVLWNLLPMFRVVCNKMRLDPVKFVTNAQRQFSPDVHRYLLRLAVKSQLVLCHKPACALK